VRLSPRLQRTAIVAVAVAIGLPALRAPFFADDMLHVAVLAATAPGPVAATPGDLFRFANGDVAQGRELMREGLFPWWSDPRLRVGFFRPLTGLTHRLDYALWGLNPFGYHLTNLVLWALMLLSAWALLVRLSPTPRAATLALWIFALADARALLIVWPANRNALIAGALSFAALALWDGFRRGEGRWRGWAAVAAFALAMLSGEVAIGGLMLFAGYELALMPDGGRFDRRRILTALPFAAIALAYVAAYKLLGYGVAHSGAYLDPMTSPLDWAKAASARYPVLLAGALWAWPVDLWVAGGEARRMLVAGALALLVATPFVFAREVRSVRAARAMAIGGALALLPVTSTFPTGRLLLVPSLAAAVLLGALVDAALARLAGTWVRRIAAAIVGLRALAAAPVLLAVSVAAIAGGFREMRDAALRTQWPADVARREVYLLDSVHWASATFVRPYLALEGRPAPRSVHVLNLSPYPAVLSRPSERALELRLQCGAMLEGDFERTTRAEPLREGDEVDVGPFRATVLEASGAGPTRVRFDFAPSDAPASFYRWDGDKYVDLPPVPVGGSLELPAVAMGIGGIGAPAPRCPPP